MPSVGLLEMADQLQLPLVQARVQPQYGGRHARWVVCVHVGSHLNLSIDWLGMWNPADLTRPETNVPVGGMAAGVPSLTGRGNSPSPWVSTAPLSGLPEADDDPPPEAHLSRSNVDEHQSGRRRGSGYRPAGSCPGRLSCLT